MDASKFREWMQQVFHTEQEEISCTECFDLVSQYVDWEVAGEAAAEKLPMLSQHLEQCRACREEYELLRDLAETEARAAPPAAAEASRVEENAAQEEIARWEGEGGSLSGDLEPPE